MRQADPLSTASSTKAQRVLMSTAGPAQTGRAATPGIRFQSDTSASTDTGVYSSDALIEARLRCGGGEGVPTGLDGFPHQCRLQAGLGDGLVDHLVVEEPGPRAPALLYAVDSDDHLACAMLLARCTEATTNRPFSMPGLGGGIRVTS